MSVEENVMLMRRWFKEVWNEGRTQTIYDLLAPDAVAIGELEDGSQLRGSAEFVPFVERIRGAFPDINIVVEDAFGAEDKVVLRWSATMTHRGDHLGMPAIRTVTQNEPLTDSEIDRLGDFLKSCKGGRAMNVEALDGFFAALIAGSETVMPSEYYPEVFGGEMSDASEFSSLNEANEILGLMMRHWNAIAATLFKGEVYMPLLLENEDGVAHGNDWAGGFMRGMRMRHDGWAELVNDDERGGCLIPMMMLYHEHSEDPKMRPKPISPEKREEVIVHMAAGLLGAYRYFRPHWQVGASAHTPEPRRNTPKVMRNDPCPCGSGKKYKKCCGGAAVN